MRKGNVLVCALLAGVCVAGGAYSLNGLQASADTAVKTVADITESNFYMSAGASVRMAESYDELGMRFQVNMDKAIYEGFSANKDYKNVSYGVLIAPISYHEIYNLNNETNLTTKYNWKLNGEADYAYEVSESRREIINLATSALQQNKYDEDVVSFNGAVVKMNEINLDKEYIGVGYIAYDVVDGDETQTHYVFAKANDNIRSMVYVAQRAIENGEDTNGSLNTYYLTEAVKAKESSFKMEYYVEENNAFTLADSMIVNANVASEVAMEKKNIDGYTYLYNKEEKLTGSVYANDKLTLKAYYVKAGTEYAVNYKNANDVSVVALTAGEYCATSLFTDGVSMRADFNLGSATVAADYTVTLPALNYEKYGTTSFTMTYATSGATVLFAGAQSAIALTKNAGATFTLIKEADGVYLYYNGAKQFALANEVACGNVGLSFTLHRGGGANHILIINPFKVQLASSTFVKSYTTADLADAKSVGLNGVAGGVSVHENKNLLFTPGESGTNYYTLPKFAFNAYATTTFTCAVWKSGSSFYYDVAGNKGFQTTALSQTISITTTTAVDGTVTAKVDNYTMTLSQDVASGKAGWQFAVYFSSTSNNALFSPITAVKGVNLNTFALSATTTATEAGDQPGVSYNASLGQMVYLYTGSYAGATAPVEYAISFAKLAYNQYDSVVFAINTSYVGTITIGGKAITVTNGAIMSLMMKTNVDGNVDVYVNNVKVQTLSESVATGAEAWTFSVTRTNVATRYQCLILQAINVVE